MKDFNERMEALNEMSREELIKEAKLGLIAQQSLDQLLEEVGDLMSGKITIEGIKKASQRLGEKSQSSFSSNKLEWKDWVKKYWIDEGCYWTSRHEIEEGFGRDDLSHYSDEELQEEYETYLNDTTDRPEAYK